MSIKERLLELNRRGLIHAPDESDDTFFLRCKKAAASNSHPSSTLAKSLFDIDPDWVWMVYDNKGLRFWEGGCTWTKQDHITLQLNKAFQKRKSYFGYSLDEVIAHELVHVVRGHFEEPIFEEILAYQTSSSSFRRFFAPLFRSPGESLFFMISLSLLLIATLLNTFPHIALLFLGLIIFGGTWRLFWAQSTFLRTRKKIDELVGKEKTLAVMLRLTDREIIRFSKMSVQEIGAYAKKMAKIHIRWEQIVFSYFKLE